MPYLFPVHELSGDLKLCLEKKTDLTNPKNSRLKGTIDQGNMQRCPKKSLSQTMQKKKLP